MLKDTAKSIPSGSVEPSAEMELLLLEWILSFQVHWDHRLENDDLCTFLSLLMEEGIVTWGNQLDTFNTKNNVFVQEILRIWSVIGILINGLHIDSDDIVGQLVMNIFTKRESSVDLWDLSDCKVEVYAYWWAQDLAWFIRYIFILSKSVYPAECQSRYAQDVIGCDFPVRPADIPSCVSLGWRNLRSAVSYF